MTVSVGRIVIVEYPGVFPGAKPGIVTGVSSLAPGEPLDQLVVDVTVFGTSPVRGHGTLEFREVKFFESFENARNVDGVGAFAYYPPRVESTPIPLAVPALNPEEDPDKQKNPNILADPDKPVAISGAVVQRIFDLAKENQGE